MFRATYFVTLMVEKPVSGANFEEALVTAKRMKPEDLVKVRHGVDEQDWRIQLYSVADVAVSGGL